MALIYNLLNASGLFLPESAATSRTYFEGTSAPEIRYGTGRADYFNFFGGGSDRLIGGAGDDVYLIGGGDTVVEKAGEGTDTVISYAGDYTLSDHVENLTVSDHRAYGGGNSLNNFIKGAAGSQSLDGGAGNDVLYGLDGADIFIMRKGNGSDVIGDFSSSQRDVIRLNGYDFQTFSEVQSRMSQSGSDTVIKLTGHETLTLRNVKTSNLDAGDFLLSLDRSGLKLSFNDDFNSLNLYNASTGTGVWRTVLRAGDDAGARTLMTNDELQIYVDPGFTGTGKTPLGVNPFSLQDGKLIITAAEATDAVSNKIWGFDYTSGLITTKMSYAQQYGYFEMRADLPDAQGAWPAFWLLPSDSAWPPEIDIFEGLGNDNVVHMTSHTTQTGKHTIDATPVHVHDSADGYHTYGLMWTKDTLTWYIDGEAMKQVATPADMHRPMYMLANMAVGGWAGTPEDNLNAQMKIDYIRAYSLDGQNSPAPAPAPQPTPAPPPPPPPPPAPKPSQGAATFLDKAGNDVFTLKTTSDIFTGPGGGTDTVLSALSWTLKAGLENLTLTGSAALTATGNTAANKLTGNAGASRLYGLDGNDTLIAGSGVTTMVGGTGNDFYQVAHSNDAVVEAAGGGIDSVQSRVSFTLSDNVENMCLTGKDNINGAGNSLANRIIGNDGDNILWGMAGNDTLIGGKGTDRLYGGSGADTFVIKPGDGRDFILDFSASENDRLDLRVFSQSSASIRQSGSDTVITLGNGQSVIIADQRANDADFLSHIIW